MPRGKNCFYKNSLFLLLFRSSSLFDFLHHSHPRSGAQTNAVVVKFGRIEELVLADRALQPNRREKAPNVFVIGVTNYLTLRIELSQP